MDETVSCRSCRHSRFDWRQFPFTIFSPYAWRCDRIRTEEQTVIDPVYGKKIVEKSERKLCVSARSKYGECGAEAIQWEPRSKRDFFVYLKRI